MKQQGLYGSLQQAVEAARYGVRPAGEADGHYAAANLAHGLSARFTGDGVRVSAAGKAGLAGGLTLRRAGLRPARAA